jgi:hypothetical protein
MKLNTLDFTNSMQLPEEIQYIILDFAVSSELCTRHMCAQTCSVWRAYLIPDRHVLVYESSFSAVNCGYVNILSSLLCDEMRADTQYIITAANNNDVKMLSWLDSQNFAYDDFAFTYATYRDNHAAVQYLHSTGRSAQRAVHYTRSSKMLKQLMDWGCVPSENTVWYMIEHGTPADIQMIFRCNSELIKTARYMVFVEHAQKNENPESMTNCLKEYIST